MEGERGCCGVALIRLLPLSPSRTLRRDSLARTIIVRTMVRETLQHRTLDAHVYLTPDDAWPSLACVPDYCAVDSWRNRCER